jgi:hypothetical protein
MINLLPNETKQSIRAARTNTLLVKYIIFIGFATAFLAIACVASYLLLNNSRIVAEKAIDGFISKNSSYSPISSRADKLRADLVTAKSILDSQISYSTIITGIAACLPVGTILESPLEISDETVGTPMELTVHSALASDETVLKSNFDKSSLFSGYKLSTITNNPSGSTEYPIIIKFSITINKASAR